MRYQAGCIHTTKDWELGSMFYSSSHHDGPITSSGGAGINQSLDSSTALLYTAPLDTVLFNKDSINIHHCSVVSLAGNQLFGSRISGKK